ncbi:hypothetical protein X942_5685 [Burkholderia pseudomallei MSHR5596]|nr:hypothetical protein X942_5685 [Burkholderia pseudomallei MSHR5596]
MRSDHAFAPPPFAARRPCGRCDSVAAGVRQGSIASPPPGDADCPGVPPRGAPGADAPASCCLMVRSTACCAAGTTTVGKITARATHSTTPATMIDLQKSARRTRVRRASAPGEDASRRRASFGPRRACVAAQAPGR